MEPFILCAVHSGILFCGLCEETATEESLTKWIVSEQQRTKSGNTHWQLGEGTNGSSQAAVIQHTGYLLQLFTQTHWAIILCVLRVLRLKYL